MVDIKDGRDSGARVDVLQTANSVCVVSSPTTSKWNKTASGSCIEIFGFYCLLTNFHVVPSASVAEETVCYFGFASGSATFKVRLNPDLIFWSSPQDELDCAIIALAVQANLPSCVRPLIPAERPVEVDDMIQVWGHPNIPGKPLQQSAGLVKKITDYTLHYRADTLDGFSGSPVISILSGKLVGLHCGGPWSSFPTAGNTGTSVLAILEKFNKEYPIANIMSYSPTSARSRSDSGLSRSDSEIDLIAHHRRLNSNTLIENDFRSISRSSSGGDSLTTTDSMSVVSSYSVPIAAEVMAMPVDFANEAALGYQVLPVEDFSSSAATTRDVTVPCAGSWCEFAATTAVGLVPVLGPLVNSVYHAAKGQYVSAIVDVVCAGVDVYTIAYASAGLNGSAADASTKIVLKESSEVLLGEMCIKKLMMGARKMLVNKESVKQIVKKGGETIVKKSVTGANCAIIRSAVVKTTTSALSTATNVLVDRPGCCSKVDVVSASEEVTEPIEELIQPTVSVIVGGVKCQ